MAEADQIRWNIRYRDNTHHFERPDPHVEQILSRIPAAGKAVDVACGLGRHSLWLARQGWEVDALDLSDVAIQRLKDTLNKNPNLSSKIHPHQEDLDDWNPGPVRYHLGLMTFFWNQDVLRKLRQAVVPGGHVVVATLLRPLTLAGPPTHYLEPGLLGGLFEDWHVWWNQEDPRTGIASIAAQKPKADHFGRTRTTQT